MKKLIISIIICCLSFSTVEAQIQFHQPVGKSKKDKKTKDRKDRNSSVLFRSSDDNSAAQERSDAPEVVTEIPASELENRNNKPSEPVTEIPASALPGYKEMPASPEVPAVKPSQPGVQYSVPRRDPMPGPGVDGMCTVAVILPFNLSSSTAAEDKKQMRSVEFYQGFLMAVDEAQKRGQHIEVLTYDIGSLNLNHILNDDGLRRAQAIVTPMETDEIMQVARFAESRGIPVVSCFKFCKELANGYPHLLQLNTSKTTLYDRLTKDLVSRFADYAVVFVRDALFASQVDAYPQIFKAELGRRGREYFDFTYDEPHAVASMDSALNLGSRNVLYVLETPQKDALRRFFPSLKNKLFLDANPALAEAVGVSVVNADVDELQLNIVASQEEADSIRQVANNRQVAILGYPEWQTYTTDFMDYFYDLNVWMFSQFYVNPFEESVQRFQDQFKYWYSKELMPLYPKYGIYGYDVAELIFTQLQHHKGVGTSFCDSFINQPLESLQTDMYFERDSEDGSLMNRGLYLIHFAPDATIQKYKIR